MVVIFALLMVTANYTQQVGLFPTVESCLLAKVLLDKTMAKPPRAVLESSVCMPTLTGVRDTSSGSGYGVSSPSPSSDQKTDTGMRTSPTKRPTHQWHSLPEA